MCCLKLKGRQRNMILINIHIPTEDKNIEEKCEFYQKLDEFLVGLPNRDCVRCQ